jgi:hypothetical protein
MKKPRRHVKHLPRNQYAELAGWLGAGIFLFDYALLSFNLIDGNSVLYHALFLLGSAGLAIVTYRHRAFQSFWVNVVFIFLACLAIGRVLLA